MSERTSLEQLAASLPRVLGELRRDPEPVRPIAVSGPPSLVTELKSLLGRDGEPGLIGSVGLLDLDRPEVGAAAAIVYVIRGKPTPADEHALRRADRQGVPLLCVLVADGPLDSVLPYVRATDVVVAPSLDAALAPLTARLACRCPDDAWRLAARLPVLRDAVMAALVRRAACRNGLLGAAAFVPGSDLPVMTINQARMLVRVAAANGRAPGRVAPIAMLGAVGAAVVLRGAARTVRMRLPLPAWTVNAAVAYAGTLLLGEASRQRSKQ